MSVTIKEIAKKAGVSEATVSRAYSKHGYVKESTRQAVENAAKELGYQHKGKHNRLSGRISKDTIGVLITDIKNPFYADLVNGICRVMEDHNMLVIACDSDEDIGKEIRYLNMLKNAVSGLIVIPVSDAAQYNNEFIVEINDKHIPVVLTDRDIKTLSIDGVFVDTYKGVYESMQVLINNGHRDIALISGMTTTKPGIERFNAYINALKDNGIPIREELILYGDFREKSGYMLAKKLFETGKKVTAVFSSNNMMSIGCLKAFDELSIQIPDDIAFITLDDNYYYSFKNVNISAIQNPGYQMGVEAAKVLIEKMHYRKKNKVSHAKRIILSPHLVLRGSEKFPRNLPGNS